MPRTPLRPLVRPKRARPQMSQSPPSNPATRDQTHERPVEDNNDPFGICRSLDDQAQATPSLPPDRNASSGGGTRSHDRPPVRTKGQGASIPPGRLGLEVLAWLFAVTFMHRMLQDLHGSVLGAVILLLLRLQVNGLLPIPAFLQVGSGKGSPVKAETVKEMQAGADRVSSLRSPDRQSRGLGGDASIHRVGLSLGAEGEPEEKAEPETDAGLSSNATSSVTGSIDHLASAPTSPPASNRLRSSDLGADLELVNRFAGRWRKNRQLSDSADEQLKALGVPWAARIAIVRAPQENVIEVDSNGAGLLWLETTINAGIRKSQTYALSNEPQETENPMDHTLVTMTSRVDVQEGCVVTLTEYAKSGIRQYIRRSVREAGQVFQVQNTMTLSDGEVIETRSHFDRI